MHYGLLAQEVALTARAAGVSGFGGHVLVDEADPESQQALRYSSFVAPLLLAARSIRCTTTTSEFVSVVRLYWC